VAAVTGLHAELRARGPVQPERRTAGYRLVATGFHQPIPVAENLSKHGLQHFCCAVAGAISGRVTEFALPRLGPHRSEAGWERDHLHLHRFRWLLPDRQSDQRLIHRRPHSDWLQLCAGLRGGRSVPASGRDFSASGSNVPPRVTFIAADPQVVPGVTSTATLSAAASGSAPLTYSWDTMLGRGPREFQRQRLRYRCLHGGCLQAAGSYRFRVRVTDSRGFSATSNVSLTVNAGPGRWSWRRMRRSLGSGKR